jgi:hypothetical protein
LHEVAEPDYLKTSGLEPDLERCAADAPMRD